MDCIFCKIANHEIPAKFIFENDQVMVIPDIAPKAKVHLLAIPKQHIANLNDIVEENKTVMGELALAIANVTAQLGIAQSGYKVITNNGHDGGQAVPHLHMHVLGGEKIPSIT